MCVILRPETNNMSCGPFFVGHKNIEINYATAP